MPKTDSRKRGLLLIMLLGTILVVTILANVAMNIILNQARFIRHQLGRTQAYYVSLAGVNYALEQLRTGSWAYPSNCVEPDGCIIEDSDFPNSIQSFNGSANRQVRVIFCPRGDTCAGSTSPCNPPVSSIDFCINSTAVYTYTNP